MMPARVPASRPSRDRTLAIVAPSLAVDPRYRSTGHHMQSLRRWHLRRVIARSDHTTAETGQHHQDSTYRLPPILNLLGHRLSGLGPYQCPRAWPQWVVPQYTHPSAGPHTLAGSHG